MTLNRQYIPAIGKRVKLQTFGDYTTFAPSISVWAWFTVRAINGNAVTLEHYNAGDTGEMFIVPAHIIERPIGWSERYTIHCKTEQAQIIINDWFKRGIVVRQSHDLSSSMPTAFQPMDNSDSPHWQFPEVTDAIQASDCPQVFRVIAVETEDIGQLPLYRSDCPHCKGTGRRTLAELAEIRHQSIDELKQLLPCSGNTFYEGSLNLEQYDDQTETFDCACRYGAFRDMGRSKRAKLVKAWKAEGWKVEYVPYGGGFWERTRETIVHDWLSEVPNA